MERHARKYATQKYRSPLLPEDRLQRRQHPVVRPPRLCLRLQPRLRHVQRVRERRRARPSPRAGRQVHQGGVPVAAKVVHRHLLQRLVRRKVHPDVRHVHRQRRREPTVQSPPHALPPQRLPQAVRHRAVLCAPVQLHLLLQRVRGHEDAVARHRRAHAGRRRGHGLVAVPVAAERALACLVSGKVHRVRRGRAGGDCRDSSEEALDAGLRDDAARDGEGGRGGGAWGVVGLQVGLDGVQREHAAVLDGACDAAGDHVLEGGAPLGLFFVAVE